MEVECHMTCLCPFSVPPNEIKIPIISPGLTFAQKAFLAGLNFGGAYFRREFCV